MVGLYYYFNSFYSDMYDVDKDYTKCMKVISSPIWTYKSL